MTVQGRFPPLYLNQDGAWQKLPGAQAGMMLGMLTDADSLQQLLNAFNELAAYKVELSGPEEVNGVPTTAYASEFTLKDGKTAKGKAWIGPCLIAGMVEWLRFTIRRR